MSSFFTRSAAIAGCILGTTGLSTHAFAQAPMLDHVMLVVGKNEAGIYDVGSGREISRIAMTGASLDTMALTNGVALFNNTGGNQVIAVNRWAARGPCTAISRPSWAAVNSMWF
jgi:hypothetical protein